MIKAYTDVEQAKQLAKILPIETADMCYMEYATSDDPTLRYEGQPPMVLGDIPITEIDVVCIPCWSLAVLYAILPYEVKDDGDIYRLQLFHLKTKYVVSYPMLTTLWPIFAQEEGDNPVDACYKMIIKLSELKFL